MIEVDSWHFQAANHEHNASYIKETFQDCNKSGCKELANVVVEHSYSTSGSAGTKTLSDTNYNESNESSAGKSFAYARANTTKLKDHEVKFSRDLVFLSRPDSNSTEEPGSMLEENATTNAAHVVAASFTTLQHVFDEFPCIAFVIPFPVIIVLLILLTFMACGCLLFLLRGYMTQKSLRRCCLGDSAYEEPSVVDAYGERSARHPSHTLRISQRSSAGCVPTLDTYGIDASTASFNREKMSSSSEEVMNSKEHRVSFKKMHDAGTTSDETEPFDPRKR